MNRITRRGTKVSAADSDPSATGPPKTFWGRLRDFCVEEYLLPLLLSAILLGILLGFLLRLRSEPYTAKELNYLRFPGDLLINMLNLVNLPLIASSIVSELTCLDKRSLGRLGVKAGVFYLTITVLASVLGTLMANIARNCTPGDKSLLPSSSSSSSSSGESRISHMAIEDMFIDFLRHIVPRNPIATTFRTEMTVEKKTPKVSSSAGLQNNATNNTNKSDETVLETTTQMGLNMVSVIVLSFVGGVVINRLGSRALSLKIVFEAGYDVTVVLIKLIRWYCPFGVVFLMMEEVASVRDPAQMFRQYYYLVTVLSSLVIYGFILLPGLYYLICRHNPFQLVKGVLQALAIAFVTSSSTTALPLTMKNLTEKNRLDPRVVQMMTFVGAALTLPATALFGPIATGFIGCMNGHGTDHLQADTMAIVCVTAILAALVTAGVNNGDLMTTILLLSAVDIPINTVAFVVPPDRVLDRFRAVINVLSDTYGAGIVHNLSNSFQRVDAQQDLPLCVPIEAVDTDNAPESTESVLNNIRPSPLNPPKHAARIVQKPSDILQPSCSCLNSTKKRGSVKLTKRPSNSSFHMQDGMKTRRVKNDIERFLAGSVSDSFSSDMTF